MLFIQQDDEVPSSSTEAQPYSIVNGDDSTNYNQSRNSTKNGTTNGNIENNQNNINTILRRTSKWTTNFNYSTLLIALNNSSCLDELFRIIFSTIFPTTNWSNIFPFFFFFFSIFFLSFQPRVHINIYFST